MRREFKGTRHENRDLTVGCRLCCLSGVWDRVCILSSIFKESWEEGSISNNRQRGKFLPWHENSNILQIHGDYAWGRFPPLGFQFCDRACIEKELWTDNYEDAF